MIPARTQSSLAVSADGESWFLVNASPDLRSQIEDFEPLQPRLNSVRQSPIEGGLLTNADLDHCLGVLLLREGEAIAIHAMQGVRATLEGSLGFDRVLGRFGGARWYEPSTEFAPLLLRDGEESGLTFRAIVLPGDPPLYAREGNVRDGHSVAYQIADSTTGGRLLIAPDVEAITPDLLTALQESDVIFFDGTFWSDDELQRVKPGARTSREMGHLPISGGSLDLLRDLPARERIYLHINNTNPILAPDSPERTQVEDAGIVVGEDGMHFQL